MTNRDCQTYVFDHTEAAADGFEYEADHLLDTLRKRRDEAEESLAHHRRGVEMYERIIAATSAAIDQLGQEKAA